MEIDPQAQPRAAAEVLRERYQESATIGLEAPEARDRRLAYASIFMNLVLAPLLEEHDAMRAIVEAVAAGCTMALRPESTWCAACLRIDTSDSLDWSGAPHDDGCPVTWARAVLAGKGQSDTGLGTIPSFGPE